VGATSEEDVNDEESITSGAPQVPTDECYQVVGTLHDQTQPKPDWVDEVFEVILQTCLMSYCILMFFFCHQCM
jgi:hypothetical protein